MDTSNNAKPNNYFPQSEFLFFNQAVNAEKMSKKLKEFNSQVLEELRVEESLLDALPSLATEAPGSPSTPLIGALTTLLSWPAANIFPVLDLVRAILLCPATQDLLLEKDILDKVFSACLEQVKKEAPAPAQMLALRTLSNMFTTTKSEQLLRTYRDSVLTRIFEKLFPIADDNKNIQIAASTLALNYSVSIHRQMDDEAQVQLLSALCINFFTFMGDWEARFRTLVATGTLLTSSPEALDYARTLEAKDGARGWRILEGPTKVTRIY